MIAGQLLICTLAIQSNGNKIRGQFHYFKLSIGANIGYRLIVGIDKRFKIVKKALSINI